MTERVFVDTNVLIYARDRREVAKRTKSEAWLLALGQAGVARTNLQVLNELTRWILRHEPGRDAIGVRGEIDAVRGWGDAPLGEDDVETAWAVRERLGYQWFDCLLVASAHNAGCRYFLTEDMAHGATFQGLVLIDPFQAEPAAIIRRN